MLRCRCRLLASESKQSVEETSGCGLIWRRGLLRGWCLGLSLASRGRVVKGCAIGQCKGRDGVEGIRSAVMKREREGGKEVVFWTLV